MNPESFLVDFTPPTAGDSANFDTPNLKNTVSGKEQISSLQKSVIRSGRIRRATASVKQARSEFEKFLLRNGLLLYTSALEFQQTGDFILSSYVIYPKHNYLQESLASFLQRYPFLQEIVYNIRDTLRPVQSQMQVRTRRLSDQDSE